LNNRACDFGGDLNKGKHHYCGVKLNAHANVGRQNNWCSTLRRHSFGHSRRCCMDPG
jgi:hypothetical protein